jgi:membrane-bound lytic murein transglycosylase D
MKHKFIYLYALIATLGIAWISLSSNQNSGKYLSASLTNFGGEGWRVRGFNLNKNFEFAGERFPVEDFDVKERLDREIMINAYMQSTTALNLKLATRYFPVIEPILAEEGMPDDFKYLAVAESTLRNVTSSAGAKGIWQFMKPTAIQYGLEVNEEIDERYHLEKATRAACRYLKNLKAQYGSWLLACAAYNEGAGRLTREMGEQRAKNYFDLNLNEETSRYVFRIMAIKEIMQHPKEYEFHIEDQYLYERFLPCSEIVVSDAVPNWADFAAKFGLNYRTFKIYNPWLISPTFTNKAKKTYTVKIPQAN